jgi:hypothetical protein
MTVSSAALPFSGKGRWPWSTWPVRRVRPSLCEPCYARHKFYWQAVRWQAGRAERSRPIDEAALVTPGVVAARRIFYTEY